MPPASKGYEELGKKKCAVFREDGAVEEAGENDTLIVKRLAADPEAFGEKFALAPKIPPADNDP